MNSVSGISPFSTKSNDFLFYSCCFQRVGASSQSCLMHQCGRSKNIGIIEIARSSKESKKQKCNRCQMQGESFCNSCRAVYCQKCSTEVHAKGKFIKHILNKISKSNPQENKDDTRQRRSNSKQTGRQNNKENQKEQEMQASIRQQQKSTELNSKNSSIATNPDYLLTPVQTKSMSPDKKSRVSFNNFSKTPLIEKSTNSPTQIQKQQPKCLIFSCREHSNKLRNMVMIGESVEIVCSDCIEESKGRWPGRSKAIDFQASKDQNNVFESLLVGMKGLMSDIHQKLDLSMVNFEQMKQSLLSELNLKQALLLEKYQSNIQGLQKWELTSHSPLRLLLKKMQQSVKQIELISLDTKKTDSPIKKKKQNDSPIKKKDKRNSLNAQTIQKIKDIYRMRMVLLTQEGGKVKKEIISNLEQFIYKVNTIPNEQFEEILKTFTVTRRKLVDQPVDPSFSSSKVMSRCTPSLNHSRLSSSSLLTDRKTLKRDESVNRYYNPYEMSTSKRKENSKEKDRERKESTGKFNKSGKIQNSANTMKDSGYFGQAKIHSYGNSKRGQSQAKGNEIAKQNEKSKHDPLRYNERSNENQVKSKEDPKSNQKQKLQHFSQIKYIDLHSFTSPLAAPIKIAQDASLQTSKESPSLHLSSSITLTSKPLAISSNMNFCSNATVSSSSIIKPRKKSDYMELRDRMRKPNLSTRFNK